MKYFLIKQEEYNDETGEFTYVPLKEIDRMTISREIMLYDEKSNNIWYSFLIEPDAKLKKVKKENIKEQLEIASKERADDLTDESFHEVSEEMFFKFLQMLLKRFENNNRTSSANDLKKIIKKIYEIKIKFS